MNIEMNGGAKKAAWGIVAAAATGLGAYVFHASGKVEPLVIQTEAIEAKLKINAEIGRDRWLDQKAWNDVFFETQKRIDEKLDLVITEVRKK